MVIHDMPGESNLPVTVRTATPKQKPSVMVMKYDESYGPAASVTMTT